MLGVEAVELARVAALPGLTVAVALIVNRGAVRLGVEVLVAAERGGVAAAAVDRRGRALLPDVVRLQTVTYGPR